MTPKEKAEELMDSIFRRAYHIKQEDAKQCALIAVEEVLLACALETKGKFEFYLEVKNEIEKL